jgi:enoyl-CoA hydratase
MTTLTKAHTMSRYAEYRDLRIEVDNKLATVTLNRPEARNAINQRLIRELRTIWDDLGDDPAVNAVLLMGAGDRFSVGGDVKAMSDRPGGDVLEEGEVHDPMISRRLVNRLLELDKPIVCAINGDCIGLAATIALLCDVTVIADDARIGDSHVNKVGLVAGDGGTVIWPLLIGVSKAKEYLMRGTLLKGPEAERIGLVNHVQPKAEVLPFARRIAQELADGPIWATRWTKLSINQIIKDRVNRLMEASMALEQVTFELADHREATRAFKEKRKPRFGGT